VNKKLVIAALAAGFATPFAMADVTIYGFMSASLETVKATGGSVTMPSQGRVSDENSRIGFKGAEDLGNGQSAIWQVESSLKNFANGGVGYNGQTATLATRNTFVGLSDAKLGTVVMGYYDTAYKRLTTTDVGTNVMANTTADTNGGGYAGVVTRGDTRLANSVHYLSPTLAGFQAAASWGADETSDYDTTGNSQRVSLAGHYINGGLVVAAGYDVKENSAGYLKSATSFSTTGNRDANIAFSKLAASYKFATGTYLGASFEHANYGSYEGNAEMTQNDWTIAASQDVGRASFKASYNKLEGLKNSGNADAFDAKQWLLGATYSLSKTTSLLAYYTQLTNGASQNANFGVDGVYTSNQSSTTATPSLAAGSKISALGAGLIVNF